ACAGATNETALEGVAAATNAVERAPRAGAACDQRATLDERDVGASSAQACVRPGEACERRGGAIHVEQPEKGAAGRARAGGKAEAGAVGVRDAQLGKRADLAQQIEQRGTVVARVFVDRDDLEAHTERAEVVSDPRAQSAHSLFVVVERNDDGH